MASPIRRHQYCFQVLSICIESYRKAEDKDSWINWQYNVIKTTRPRYYGMYSSHALHDNYPADLSCRAVRLQFDSEADTTNRIWIDSLPHDKHIYDLTLDEFHNYVQTVVAMYEAVFIHLTRNTQVPFRTHTYTQIEGVDVRVIYGTKQKPSQ